MGNIMRVYFIQKKRTMMIRFFREMPDKSRSIQTTVKDLSRRWKVKGTGLFSYYLGCHMQNQRQNLKTSG